MGLEDVRGGEEPSNGSPPPPHLLQPLPTGHHRHRGKLTPPPSPRRNQKNYENNIESQITDSLRILGLESGVTGMEKNIRYRFLARRLHPDKNDPEKTGMTSEEAVEQFKRVNNAQEFRQFPFGIKQALSLLW